MQRTRTTDCDNPMVQEKIQALRQQVALGHAPFVLVRLSSHTQPVNATMMHTSDANAIVDMRPNQRDYCAAAHGAAAGRRTRCAGCVDAGAERGPGATRKSTKGGPRQTSSHTPALLVQGQGSGWSLIVCDRAPPGRALRVLRETTSSGENAKHARAHIVRTHTRQNMRNRHIHTAHAHTHTHVHTNRQHSWKKRSSAQALTNILSAGDLTKATNT